MYNVNLNPIIFEVVEAMHADADLHEYALDLDMGHVLACLSQYNAGWTLDQIFAHYNLSDDTQRAIRKIVSR